jgi:beta-alanine degradation protein BauB
MAEPSENVGSRLLFENDRVRVWDVSLEPGETLEKHIHRLDYVILVESGGQLRSSDPEDSANDRDIQFQDDQVEFRVVGAGKVDNLLTNVGTKRHRNYVIELKRG